LYGTSEVWDATWYEVPATGVNGLFVPIGKAISNVEVVVVDENIRPGPRGTLGEIAISGTGLALGYLSRPSLGGKQSLTDLSGSGINGKGFYLTGDLGRFTENGELVFLGRRESFVRRANHTINLIEIEAALTLHPMVMESAVGSCRNDLDEIEL